jgi:hypothetical protein
VVLECGMHRVAIKPALMALLATTLPWPAVADEQSAGFIARGFGDCVRFNQALMGADLSDEPDLFLCHEFRYKPLFMVGFVRFLGHRTFSVTLVTDRHGICTGTGDLAWSDAGGQRHVSASGRYLCDDESEGGIAFEVDEFVEARRTVLAGSALAGVDGNRARDNTGERISADMWIYSRALAGDVPTVSPED